VRGLADVERLRAFMRALGREADRSGRVYFTGGATAVLLGWRETTIDADILLVPESDRLLRAVASLKETLSLNVELASPADFIPELPGWADRSPFVEQHGLLAFHHYDFYAQALAKIERGHEQDRRDVAEMLTRGMIEPRRVWEFYERIEPELYRYPALDGPAFRRAVTEALGPA
jgi:hypothetical protein